MIRTQPLLAKVTCRMLLRPLAAFGLLSVTTAAWAAVNDYPTAARADYVFACMVSNGQTRQALEQCS